MRWFRRICIRSKSIWWLSDLVFFCNFSDVCILNGNFLSGYWNGGKRLAFCRLRTANTTASSIGSLRRYVQIFRNKKEKEKRNVRNNERSERPLTGYSSNSTDTFFSLIGGCGCGSGWSSGIRLSYLSNVNGSSGFWNAEPHVATVHSDSRNNAVFFHTTMLTVLSLISTWKNRVRAIIKRRSVCSTYHTACEPVEIPRDNAASRIRRRLTGASSRVLGMKLISCPPPYHRLYASIARFYRNARQKSWTF